MKTPRPRALVTGASSGFGADFARQLAARGHDLVLVARSEAPMQALAAQLRASHACDVRIIPMDLGQPDAARTLKQHTDAAGLQIDLLVNNAGFGLYGAFLDRSLDETAAMLQLNIGTLTALTHLYGRDMVARGHGHILLVASIGGYQATPTYAAYSASKAYVLLLGEALHDEMAGSGVNVSVVAPGIAATGFLQASGQKATPYQRLVMMQSRDVVARALRALDRREASVVPGWLNALTAWSNRLTPRSLQRKIAGYLMHNPAS